MPYRAAFLGLSIWVMWRAFEQGRSIARGRYLWILIAFWVIFLLRMFADTVLMERDLYFTTAEYWLMTLGITLVPSAGFLVVPNRATLLFAAELCLFLALAATAANLFAGFGLQGVVTGRFQTETLNPISFGQIGLTLIITSIYLLLHVWPEYSDRIDNSLTFVKAMRVSLILAAPIVGAVVIFMSGSRGPLVAAALCLIISMVTRRKSGGWSKVRSLILLIGIVSALILALPAVIEEGGIIIDRFISSSVIDDSNMSDQDRVGLWGGAWQQFVDNPMLGFGLEEPIQRFYPHNMLLESLMACGILGGVLYTTCFIGGLSHGITALREQIGAWVAFMLFANSANALYTGNVWGSWAYWHMLCAAYAIAWQIQRDRKQGSKQIAPTLVHAPLTPTPLSRHAKFPF
jgi:hypothetical protein